MFTSGTVGTAIATMPDPGLLEEVFVVADKAATRITLATKAELIIMIVIQRRRETRRS